jgi:ribosomal protein L11 methyltransferase
VTRALVRVTVPVPADAAEQTVARLLALVPAGLEESVAGDALHVYVAPGEVAAVLAAFPGAASASVPEGWEHAWRAFHHPVVAGGVWVGPPWEPAPAGLPAVTIDPGRAFGTGSHPTTRLCLELLAAAERGSLLDVGCGSGVLAIAGVRLGFAPVTALDHDPVAVEVTAVNAAANGVAVETRVLDAEHDGLPAADVAVANVLLRPVETVLERLDAAVAITSGYRALERPTHAGWEHVETRVLDGWAADRFRRVAS